MTGNGLGMFLIKEWCMTNPLAVESKDLHQHWYLVWRAGTLTFCTAQVPSCSPGIYVEQQHPGFDGKFCSESDWWSIRNYKIWWWVIILKNVGTAGMENSWDRGVLLLAWIPSVKVRGRHMFSAVRKSNFSSWVGRFLLHLFRHLCYIRTEWGFFE